MRIFKITGYNWLKKWNKSGLKGLIPEYGESRSPKLTKQQRLKLKELIIEKDIKTTKKVHKLLRSEFDVGYSNK